MSVPTVSFHASLSVLDRDPEILTNQGYTHTGKPFRSGVYVAQAVWGSPPRWTWSRRGPILRKDGSPYADANGTVSIPAAEVPVYVKKELAERLAKQAMNAAADMQAWAQAAADLEGVTA